MEYLAEIFSGYGLDKILLLLFSIVIASIGIIIILKTALKTLSSKKKPAKVKTSVYHNLKRSTRSRILAGLAVTIPLGITFLILRFIINLMDGILAPSINKAIGFRIPGLGILLGVILVYLIGIFATNILGRRMVHLFDNLITKIPLVKRIYSASKQFVGYFSSSSTMKFNKVVLVEYPRKGLLTIGFLSGEIWDSDQKRFLSGVFLPTTPNPTSGWYILLPKEDVRETDLSIEDGLKLVISGGVLAPKGFSSLSEVPPHSSDKSEEKVKS